LTLFCLHQMHEAWLLYKAHISSKSAHQINIIVFTRLLVVVIPFSTFTFHFSLFAFAFLFFLAFDVPNVVILFSLSFHIFQHQHTAHYHTKSDFENTFGSSKIKEAKIEEKPTRIKIGHENQTNIRENLTLGICQWSNDKYELKYVNKKHSKGVIWWSFVNKEEHIFLWFSKAQN